MAAARFKLVFFCPIKNTSEILERLFKSHPTHIGRLGEYECCAFITPGTGQFKPLISANPHIGSVIGGQLESVEEHRVEVLVKDEGQNEQIRGAVNELKKAHPYEEVAYEVYRIEDF